MSIETETNTMESNAKCFGLLREYAGFIYITIAQNQIDLPLANTSNFPSDTNIISQRLCSCLEGQHSIFFSLTLSIKLKSQKKRVLPQRQQVP